MAGIFNDPVMTLLTKAMGTYSMRQDVMANNIANVNTPAFKRSLVRFEETLRGKLAGDDILDDLAARMGEVEEFEPSTEVDRLTASRYDGNNVNIDQEMAELSKNGVRYSAATSILRVKFQMLQHVISSGRR